ncbi:hypothetical protein BKA56DRAFT_535586 [Ilyonectria sp. MPI-CAGE-AT-0026]|nr:hypothetical protein BKA56DRAFT_535586 [Ilyonectria sp. MPI-CAGE-AT-0026]
MAPTNDLGLTRQDLIDHYIQEWSDEDAVYSENYPKDPDPTLGALQVNLYRMGDDQRDGAVKATFKGDGSTPLLYSNETSNYYLAVERLLWLDGIRGGVARAGTDEKPEDEMTLVVLKLVFQASSRDSKVSFAAMQLRFQSNEKGKGDDPEVVAWGPFNRPKTWNHSKAQRRVNTKTELRAGGGGAGQNLSGGVAREDETSWDQVDFDRGSSHQLTSKSKGTRNGALWMVTQNQLYNEGITQDMRVAVLIRRPQPREPYFVSLRLEAHTGTMSTLWSKGQHLLGLPGGEEIVWQAKPDRGSKAGCHAEGVHIAQSVDLSNLGALVRDPSDSTNLDPDWLNPPRDGLEMQKAAAASEPEAKTEPVGGAEAVSMSASGFGADVEMRWERPADATKGPAPSVSGPRPATSVPAAAAAGDEVLARGSARGLEAAIPIGLRPEAGLFMSTSPPPGVDNHGYHRLVSLEARAAQTEARLAAQDQLIFKLQQALASRSQVIATCLSPPHPRPNLFPAMPAAAGPIGSSAGSKGHDKLAMTKNRKPSAKQKDQSKISAAWATLNSVHKAPEKGTKQGKFRSLAKILMQAAVDLLKQDEDSAGDLEQYLEKNTKDSKMDDCVRWYLLMEAVKPEDSQDDGTMEARVQLSKMLIKPRPYLAFESPLDSDKSNKIYTFSCKDTTMHTHPERNTTPFHVAAKHGNAKVIEAMILRGLEFHKASPNTDYDKDKLSCRPKFPKGWSLVNILQQHDPKSMDTALMLAAKAKHGSVDTLKELLKVDGILFIENPAKKKKKVDRVFDLAIDLGLADVLDELLKNPALAKQLVTIESIKQAIQSLEESVDSVKSDEASPGHRGPRSRIVKSLICQADQSGTFNRRIVEMIIEEGSMAVFKGLPENFITTELRNCLLHLAVKYQSHDFVKLFIDVDSASVEREVVVFPRDEKRYPLWYNNHVREGAEFNGIGSGRPSDRVRADIRDTIVTTMIHMVTDMEQLSDIFYKSDEPMGDVCFDMSHINSASYRVSDVVDSMIRQNQSQKHLTYEKTLRYAEFPPLDMLVGERETFKESRHLKPRHTEVFKILKWLEKDKDVNTIIKLKVPDRLINPHDNKEMAACVDNFQVTVLEWRVLDLSISVLKKGTKDRIEELHLFSSGNRAVVSHWFSSEGLCSLPKLKLLFITVVEETCTLERCNAIINEISSQSKSLRESKTGLRIITDHAAWYPTPKLTDLSELANRISPKLAQLLKKLGSEVSGRGGGFKPTKVAILDNGILSIPPISHNASGDAGSGYGNETLGINGHGGATNRRDGSDPGGAAKEAEDSRSLWKRIKEGRSFVDADSKHSPWYFASNAHGTQMANLICAIDPFCEIYVARVAEDAFGITPKRVEKAIAWAVGKDVDIISMSFILEETTKELESQIDAASQKGIVMTCSTHDEGSRIDKAFPASLKGGTTSLLVLAACDVYGRILREAKEDTYDYLIRGKDVAAGVIPFLKSEDTITGSSVATALAAALCSLILTCNRLAHPVVTYEGGKGENSRYSLVTKHLTRMKSHENTKFILLEKFGKIEELGKTYDGTILAKRVLQESFEM